MGFVYTLTAEHLMIVALGTYVIAFASSETKQCKYYSDAEKVLIDYDSGPDIETTNLELGGDDSNRSVSFGAWPEHGTLTL